MFNENYFGVLDYLVLAGTMLICLVVGVYYAYFSQHTNEELLVGGRSMSVFPIAASIMVSFFSAITILGIPAEIYSFGIETYCQAILQCAGIAFCALWIIPFLYPMRFTSIYEYYERRFDSKILRKIPALIFIFEQMMLSGMILFAPCIALETFLGFPLWLSIFGVGICGTIYTAIGGLKAVVWTDTFQFVILLVGLLAIMVKAFMEAGGVGPAFSIAYDAGRLKLFNFNFDPFMRHNFWNFLLGSFVVQTFRTAGHQMLVQRYMSLPTVEHAKKSFLISIPLKLGLMGIMILVGIALFAATAGCDPVLSHKVTKYDQMVALFVVEKLSNIPGYLGLFSAAMFSGVLSSISSSVNAMTAVIWQDFLSEVPVFKRMSPKSQTNISRMLSLLIGIMAMGAAFTMQNLKFIFAASYAVTGATTGAYCAVLVMSMLMPFVNRIGAIIGTLMGFLIVFSISVLGLIYPPHVNRLPVRVDECEMPISVNSTLPPSDPYGEMSFPLNLHALSYILYTFSALFLSVVVAIIISGLSGGFTRKQMDIVKPELIHPCARIFLSKKRRNTTESEMTTFSPKS